MNGSAPLRRLGLPAGLAAVQIVLAYEWLLSGINKILNPNFTLQLGATLQQNISGNPYGWYSGLLRAVVLPHAGTFGILTELGEVSIGLTLLGSALLWLRRPHSRLAVIAGKVACLALAGAILLPLNFFFMSGDPVPWVNPGNAFNEGVSIDALIPLLSATLLVANLRAVRTASRFAAQQLSRQWMPWAS
jgi:thiosulfate dehydrogenase [quinone] large subunit